MHMDYENLTPQYRIEEYLEAIVSGWVDATMVAYPEVPSWRIEEFLDAFITYIWEDEGHPRHPCPNPVWRLEECLRAIYDVMTGAATPWPFPTPTNRIEEYLAAIHAYLADNTELPVPEPVWRIEQWLAYVLDAVKQGGGVETTVSGTLVHITNALAKAALSVLASIEPIQDLHGYSNPWPAGGGKNAMPSGEAGTKESNGITVTSDGHGHYTVSGTSSSAVEILFDLETEFTIPTSDTHSLFFMNDIGVSGVTFYFRNGSTNIDSFGLSTANKSSASYVTIGGKVCNRVRFYISPNTAIPGTMHLSPMIVTKDVTGNSFIPYSNICPISGRTGLSVYVGPTQDQQDATTYAVDWTTEAGTVYGGTLDVVTGVLTVDRASVDMGTLNWQYEPSGATRFFTDGLRSSIKFPTNYDTAANAISSMYANRTYNQFAATEKANGTMAVSSSGWLSVRNTAYADVASFTAAMNGQTFVYELATPLTYQLTPQEVQMLLGENYVWASSGDTVSVTYYAEGNANPMQSLNILLGGNYSNPKTADDVSDKEALEIILGGNK